MKPTRACGRRSTGAGRPLPAPAIRIDAWIDPPGYTRLPPILIDFARLNSPNLSAPEKSTIVVRIAGKTSMDVATTGRLDVLPAAEAGAAKAAAAAGDQPAVLEKRYSLAGNGTLRLTGSGAPNATLHLTAIADQPPQVSFTETPKPVTGGAGRRARADLQCQGRLRRRRRRGERRARRAALERALAGRAAEADAQRAVLGFRR